MFAKTAIGRIRPVDPTTGLPTGAFVTIGSVTGHSIDSVAYHSIGGKGGVVFDPFCGTGTTAVVATIMRRMKEIENIPAWLTALFLELGI